MLETDLIQHVTEANPEWRVQVAPDMVSANAERLITLRMSASPVQEALGARFVVDVAAYSADRTAAIEKCKEVLTQVRDAVHEGKLPVSSFSPITLPSLVYGDRGAAFSFVVTGRYLPDV